jgi:hypothetical protein
MLWVGVWVMLVSETEWARRESGNTGADMRLSQERRRGTGSKPAECEGGTQSEGRSEKLAPVRNSVRCVATWSELSKRQCTTQLGPAQCGTEKAGTCAPRSQRLKWGRRRRSEAKSGVSARHCSATVAHSRSRGGRAAWSELVAKQMCIANKKGTDARRR